MAVIDFHSHVLYKVDDGSRSREMSIQMLEESAKQGINIQVATPHFYPDRMHAEPFFKKRDESYALLLDEARKLNIDLRLGAEVAFFGAMDEWDLLDKFVIMGTNLLLVEMPFEQWTDKNVETLENLRYRGVRPIIAHLERFISFQKDKGPLERVLDGDFIIQFNCEDILKFWRRSKMLKLIDETENVILGSDCHNLEMRPQNIEEAREIIAKKLGHERLKLIDDFGTSLLVNNRTK